MDFWRLLQSAEDLLFEILASIALWPKTLFRIIAHPRETFAYVDAELDKAPGERYDSMLSPVLFLAMSVILGLTTYPPIKILQPLELRPSLASALEGSAAAQLGFLIVTSSVIPLCFAVGYTLGAGEEVSRTALRNRLAKQCYLQGVVGVGTAMTEQLTPYVGVENVMNVFGPFLVWFVCAQTVALSSERQIRPESVFRRVVITFCGTLMVLWSLEWLFLR